MIVCNHEISIAYKKEITLHTIWKLKVTSATKLFSAIK